MIYKLISAVPPPTLSPYNCGNTQLVGGAGQGREGKKGKPTLRVQRYSIGASIDDKNVTFKFKLHSFNS